MLREYDKFYYNSNEIKERPLKRSERINKARMRAHVCVRALNIAKEYDDKEKISALEANVRLAEHNLLKEQESAPTYRIKKTYKKIPMEKLKRLVESDIKCAKNANISFVTAEEIAFKYNVKVHTIKQIFQEMNIAGVLEQPRHQVPHDCNRDKMGCGGFWNFGNVFISYCLEFRLV